jgi:hypothetical protein
MDERTITWNAPEFHFYPKNETWFAAALGITGLVIVLALWQKNFLFTIFAVLACTLAFTWGKRPPRTVAFELSEKIFTIAERKSYALADIEGFAVVPTDESPDLSELILKPKKKISTYIKALLPTEKAEAVKELLGAKLPEVEYEESTADRIGKILRF